MKDLFNYEYFTIKLLSSFNIIIDFFPLRLYIFFTFCSSGSFDPDVHSMYIVKEDQEETELKKEEGIKQEEYNLQGDISLRFHKDATSVLNPDLGF